MRQSQRQLRRLDNAVHSEVEQCPVCEKSLFGDEPLHKSKRYHADCLVELGKREERKNTPIQPVIPFTPQPIGIPANPYPNSYPIIVTPNTYPGTGGTAITPSDWWWKITTTDGTSSTAFTADDFNDEKWNSTLFGSNIHTSSYVSTNTIYTLNTTSL